MKLGTSNYWITINKQQELWSNLYGEGKHIVDPVEFNAVMSIYRTFTKRTLDETSKMEALVRFLQNNNISVSTDTQKVIDKFAVQTAIQNLIDFFSEFEFEPNFRFINSFTYACNVSHDEASNYVKNYFELVDSPYINSIIEKMKSAEFRIIIDDLFGIVPTHKVNNRFKLYYGSQGTGKTTQALKETAGNCMVCHSAMLPSDLMEDFKFDNGQATFIPSALQVAMTSGKPIVLDEINLLPFESLRFLQSVLDSKTQFEYKGKTIVIKDGFKIIGTMNLHVNGCTYALPEPLVDRAETLKKFNLTAEHLIGAII